MNVHIKQFLNLYKNKLAILAATGVAVGTVLAVANFASAGFGPGRPVFDWNNPNDHDGSLIGPVFNSFINTDTYGDERNLARVAAVVPGQSPVQADFHEQQVAEAGKEYWVRTFVHNNANSTTNCLPNHRDSQGRCPQVDPDAIGVAKNVRLKFTIPQGEVNGLDMTSTISSSNGVNRDGQPMTSVYDTATLANSNRDFSVAYVPGSTIIYNRAHQNGLPLADGITSASGIPLGYDQMNGNLPGCFEFSAYVYVKVRVSTSDLSINKYVRKAGTSAWGETANVKPGETVDWVIDVLNTGSTVQHNVIANDALPPHLEYVPGTAQWETTEQGRVPFDFDKFELSDGDGSNMNAGNYGPNGNLRIYFSTKAKGDFQECQVRLRNIASARSSEIPTNQEDSADVVITKENCQPTTPTYVCDLLKADKLGDRKYRFTTTATGTNGATVRRYFYSFGDDTPELTTDKNVVEHTYAKEGKYPVSVRVEFTVNGTAQTVTGPSCAVTIDTGVTPKPPELPKTGAGDVFGLFASTTIAGALAHRYVWARRYNR